jgi:hypothetical protein
VRETKPFHQRSAEVSPHADEDVMWQRLKDEQREAENRRLVGTSPVLIELAARAWRLISLATRRPWRRFSAADGRSRD